MAFFDRLFGKEKTAKPEPIVITNELGSFTSDGGGRVFEGEVDWCGNRVTVFLQPDENNDSEINQSFEILRRLLSNAVEWDNRLREYSANDFLDDDGLIHIWGSPEQLHEDVEPVTKEEFISRISLGFMDISPNGDIYFDYSLDDMFTDHGEGIFANISGEIFSAGLQG